ncbi:hypothetical protein E2C01_031949 [Portunus trituberculatus]|uniref:Uncharacterized protein n=1 Tax=Portunus trituberculatus TaxID=210409 RepID=A0A5B7F015_PORTR|nr:hypothetical protein [Portunus trituberculatus]
MAGISSLPLLGREVAPPSDSYPADSTCVDSSSSSLKVFRGYLDLISMVPEFEVLPVYLRGKKKKKKKNYGLTRLKETWNDRKKTSHPGVVKKSSGCCSNTAATNAITSALPHAYREYHRKRYRLCRPAATFRVFLRRNI